MRYQTADFCAACKRDYFQHLAQGTLNDRNTPPHYFARRAMAKMVDLVMHFLLLISLNATLSILDPYPTAMWTTGVSAGVTLIIFLVSSTVFTAQFGGTPGKLLFHLQTVYRDGTALSRGSAFTRALAELASMACVGLGYFITDGEGARRTLHDRLSGTEVVARREDWPWTP